MSDELWTNGFFEALRGIGSGFDFFKSIISTFLGQLMEFPILTILLGICVFATVVFFGVEFFLNFVSSFDSFAESTSDFYVKEKRYNERKEQNRAEADKRYKERKEQNRIEAEKRYKERKEQNRIEAEKRYEERKEKNRLAAEYRAQLNFEKRFPLLKQYSFEDLSAAYFETYPERVSFSYGGQTAYNQALLDNLDKKHFYKKKNFFEKEIKSIMKSDGVSRDEAISLLKMSAEKGMFYGNDNEWFLNNY